MATKAECPGLQSTLKRSQNRATTVREGERKCQRRRYEKSSFCQSWWEQLQPQFEVCAQLLQQLALGRTERYHCAERTANLKWQARSSGHLTPPLSTQMKGRRI